MARLCAFSLIEEGSCPHCLTQRHLSPAPGCRSTFGVATEDGVAWEPAPGPWFEARERLVCRWGCVIDPGDAARADGLGHFLCADCGTD